MPAASRRCWASTAPLRSYYQKTYPQVYADKQDAIKGAIAALQNIYDRYFFPAMKVRWDTYPTNDTHFYSVGCFRCHDGQHKSVDGSVIRSDCDTCHKIMRQGKTESLQFATGSAGLDFHPPRGHRRRLGGAVVHLVPFGRIDVSDSYTPFPSAEFGRSSGRARSRGGTTENAARTCAAKTTARTEQFRERI